VAPRPPGWPAAAGTTGIP